ncbi:helix-turn-helix domain-containing protein [Paenibacillus agaridevorans]|uniref:helix-turn-helix domain-containing protein n=1 Tax=Paenibacillus agaridevorans TaxID=171404 RepID=UPI001BE3D3A9|nr:helix-turn-helix domain-containing protein [Paenibacillus agaridevorans]
MKSNWFNRLLISYLPIFFIISLSLLFMTYFTLNEMSRDAAIRANQALTGNIAKLLDSNLASIDALMLYEIRNNASLRDFFSDGAGPQQQLIDVQASGFLKEFVQNNPMLHSLYLYRTPDMTVLTPATRTKLEHFADRQHIGLMVNSSELYKWTARAIPTDGGDQDTGLPVISLAKTANLKNLSIMVANVRIELLYEWITSMVDKQLTFVHIIDPQGNIIVSTVEAAKTGTAASAKDVLSTTSSEQTGWIIASGNRDVGLFSFVSSQFYLWMGGAAFIVVAGFSWIVFVSRRQYKPIQGLISLAARARQGQASASVAVAEDEFKLIGSAIEELLDESNALQEQQKELSIYHKRHLFLSLMEEVHTEANFGSYLTEEMLRLGIDKPTTGTMVAIVEIDSYEEFANQYRDDQHLLKYILGAAIKEVTENKPYTVWTEWISNAKLGVLYLFHDGESEQEAYERSEELRDWVANNMDFTVTIGIGSMAQRLELTAESFQGAIAAIGYKFSLGMNRLICSSDISAQPKGELFRQLQYVRVISKSIRQGEDKWQAYYEEMLQVLSGQLNTREDVINLMQALTGYLQKDMAELGDEIYAMWMEEVHPSLQLILEEETQKEVVHAYQQQLKKGFEQIRQLRESKLAHQQMHVIKQYIEEQYNNADLSLSHLSDVFNFSTSYLSRLFREAFGMKFIDFVTRVRMEKAIELLAETEEAIQDIGRAVGYDQSLTFIRVFKKYTGETPGQYRKKLWTE